MALTLSARALSALKQTAKEPNIVLEIEGYGTILGATLVREYVRIGGGFEEPEAGDRVPEIDDPETNPLGFYIGGLWDVGAQENVMTLDETSTSIKQTLNIDKGQGGTISGLNIALMDDGSITELITPGLILDDMLQRRCKVWFGFKETAWPDDYAIIFRGVVTDINPDPGKVVIQLSHPDDKKRSNIYKKVETTLTGAITSSATVIPVTSVENMLTRILGPDGTYDSSFFSYVRIEDELIRYVNAAAARDFTATVTIASPGVWSATAHGMEDGEPVVPTSTGALPSGITAGSTYYVVNKTANTFKLALAPGGTAIDTTGSQSGVHTISLSPRLTGVTRSQLNTSALAHDAETDVSTYYRLKGNGVHLALKLMASGYNGPFIDALYPSKVNFSGSQRVDNSFFFAGEKVQDKYGLNIGDYVTSTNPTYGVNEFTAKQILDIVSTDNGDFVVVDQALTDGEGSGITLSVRSQYDVLPDGLSMHGDEIDVIEHLRLYQLFLSSVDYDFYLKDSIEDAKEFIETEIYSPMAAYSLPRKSRASMGYHIGPIPGQNIVTFSKSNIKNPSRARIRRSTSRQFYNEIVYKFDEHPTADKFLSGYIGISETSKNRIPGKNQTLTITSKGLRTTDFAQSIAQIQSSRRLRRYEFAAEVLTFEAMLFDSFAVEIGDIIVFDGTDLQLPDTKTGKKGIAPRMFEIQNKDFQIKTGDVKFEAVDTHFNGAARYGLISPASKIKLGISTTSFVIEPSFGSRFGAFEYRKWEKLVGSSIRVRNDDFSQVSDSVILSASSNTIALSSPLGFVPTIGMIMEFTGYADADTTERQKLVYAYMSDLSDDSDPYSML